MSEYGYPSAPQAYPAPTSGPPLSGWWRRVGASLIDGILIGVIASVVGFAIGATASRVLEVVLAAIYTTAMLGSGGRTLGNMAVGTFVVPDTGQGKISYGTAFLRWLVQIVLGVTVIGGILDILWPLWDGRNQTLHDKALNTLVVHPQGAYT